MSEGFKKACEAAGDPLTYEYILNTTVTTEGVTSRGARAVCHGPRPHAPIFRSRRVCARRVRDRPSKWRLPSAIDVVVRDGFHTVPGGVSTDPEKRKLGLHLHEDAALSLFRPVGRAADLLHVNVLPVAVERRPLTFRVDSKMADILHHVPDELHYAVALRDIRHYFIAGVNLLEHVHPSFASDLVTKISRLRRYLVASVLRIDDRVRFIELVNRRHARLSLLAPLADMTAKDDVTSVVRFDHSCRVTLDAMFTETLSVLVKMTDAAESLTDQALRLLCDINTNTFMCIVDSLL